MTGDCGPGADGQNDHHRPESDEMESAAHSIRRAHVRRLARESRVPADKRVSGDGTRIERAEGPWWPATPFDQPCRVVRSRPDLLGLIQRAFPDFNPDSNVESWLIIGEYIMRSGRSQDDVRRMTLEQIEAFFQCDIRQTASAAGDTMAASSGGPVRDGSAAEMAVRGGETVEQALTRIMGTRAGMLRLLDAGSAEKVAIMLGVGTTSIKEAGLAWATLRGRLAARRTEDRLARHHSRNRP